MRLALAFMCVFALLCGCAAVPQAKPGASTGAVVASAGVKVSDATAKNTQILAQFNILDEYFGKWLPANAPSIATQPATIAAASAVTTGKTLTIAQASDLGGAKVAVESAAASAATDAKIVAKQAKEITDLKKADPVKSWLTLGAIAGISVGVLLIVLSMFFATMPLLGTYGMQLGVALVAAGTVLAVIVRYFDAIRLGLLITLLVAVAAGLMTYIVTHWAVIREALGIKAKTTPPAT